MSSQYCNHLASAENKAVGWTAHWSPGKRDEIRKHPERVEKIVTICKVRLVLRCSFACQLHKFDPADFVRWGLADPDEMIEELSNAALPALLVFQRAGTSFHEAGSFDHLDPQRPTVEVELQPPARVKSMSFMTGKDVPGLDPVCWKVEGFVADKKGGGRWKQLVWQDKPYAPPFKRETDLCVVFDVEHWRVDKSGGRTSKVASLTLQSFLPVVQERLSFFTASLRSLLRSSEKYGIRAGIDTLLDSHIGNIPSLTQVIPCYNETVILSKQYLQEDDGLNSNLAFIISQFPEEWAFFCERHDFTPKGMHNAFMGRGDHMLTPAVIMEVRMWASMRSQTVARTVVGAMQYQEVVAMLPSVQSAENPGKALESCVELVLAHQTYGSKAGTPANDESVRYLLAKYRHLCFFLVFDFDADKSRPDIVTAVNNFVREKYRFDRPVRHASVLARFRKGAYKEDDFEVPESAVEILEVLPRCFALLVGTPGFMTQGKAGNQLGALRFSRGHFLQMMDANMGAFLGEATKVPFILRRFQPHWTDRTTVRARIIGFREFIFTESHGAVGSVMASAEWSFGTICQRFLAGLGARMHYGHPDFLDGFWASNRGSLSKASPAINLSEDIFAGFNVRMRGEASKHVDALAWEKGRESSFNAAALFYTKVSKGNVGVMRSRDLKVITQNLNIVDNFSFYFASVGFYLNNLLIDASATVYVLLFILLALSSKSLVDVASLDSMLATEWTLSMGTIAMLPRFMELTLEYGPLEGILRFVPSIPGCMTMFTFINKSIASGVQETMVTGEASYIATGRPNANTHYSWKECYFIHCSSHYYPALRIFIGYSIYVLVSQAQGFSTLPMMVLLASAVMWLIAPILFCPQPTLASLGHDLSEFWQFAIAAPDWSVRTLSRQLGSKDTEEHLRTGLRDPRSTLYEFWLLKALEHKKFSCFQRVGFLLLEILCVVFLLSVVYSSLLDDIWLVILLYSIHYLLMEIWRLLYRPTVLTLLTTVMWLLVPVIIQMPLLNSFFLLLILVVTLQAVRSLVLLLVWGVLRPNLDWKKMPENSESERAAKQATARRVLQYDIAVEYLYVNLMGHQLHLYAAFAILLMNFAVQFVLVLLELLYGLHSWALLNPRLRSRRCCQTRRGYEPS
ncbi:CALS12 [Symbiodinium sp. CCMP2592]|nr:CALS12 [Symbiodinium sp. CCMP2592]